MTEQKPRNFFYKWDGILYTKGGTLVYLWHFPKTFAIITTMMTKGGIEFKEFHK
jgi:hypothetical protein